MALTQVQGQMLSGSSNTTTTIQSNGTTAITIDSSQNVGIGTATPTQELHLYRSSGATDMLIEQASSGNAYVHTKNTSREYAIGTRTDALAFFDVTADAERMRIDSSGALIVGATDITGWGGNYINAKSATAGNQCFSAWNAAVSGTRYFAYFGVNSTYLNTGAITSNGSTTSYVTTSDYRLKENVAPMTGALETVAKLKPVTYRWKDSGIEDNGFIAHELQEVLPNAVVGEKDAVNEDGSIDPQAIDTSFLVATLTAAVQELNAKVTALETKLAAK